jgi:tetratricopeptide (TPR) repeat protein
MITSLLLAAALVAQDPGVAASADKLEKAVLSEDVAAVKDVRTGLLRQLSANPGGPAAPMLRYTIAYAGWRLAFSPKIAAAEQDALLSDADTQLSQALKADPKFADAYVLLASVYGARISKNPDLGMTLGPSSGAMLERAAAIDPSNPRLMVARAQSLLHTPPEYGGNPKQAEAEFRKAIQAFANEPAGKAWPNWGLFDARAFLGQALLARGDKAGARAEFDAALAIAPGNGWVTHVLMPQVKEP